MLLRRYKYNKKSNRTCLHTKNKDCCYYQLGKVDKLNMIKIFINKLCESTDFGCVCKVKDKCKDYIKLKAKIKKYDSRYSR